MSQKVIYVIDSSIYVVWGEHIEIFVTLDQFLLNRWAKVEVLDSSDIGQTKAVLEPGQGGDFWDPKLIIIVILKLHKPIPSNGDNLSSTHSPRAGRDGINAKKVSEADRLIYGCLPLTFDLNLDIIPPSRVIRSYTLDVSII